MDVHVSLRAFSIGVGPRWDPLESRGQPAPWLAMPELRAVDVTCDFEEPADATGLVTVKSPGAVGRSDSASVAVKPVRTVES